MTGLTRLRFKVFTSVVISALGAVMLLRLLQSVPLSGSSIGAYFTAALIAAAGAWRALIFYRAIATRDAL